MTTTPGETPTYSRPVYANQAAANGAVIDRFTEQLRRVRRNLSHDLGIDLEELVYRTGYSELEVDDALAVLCGLELAEVHVTDQIRFYAKDVPNG